MLRRNATAALHGGAVGRVAPGVGLFRGYGIPEAARDLLAALTLWAVVVPQGLAYGELAGLTGIAGLRTAMAGMLLYGLFASSRYLNVGPESSVAIVVAAAIAGPAGGDPDRAAAIAATIALLTGGLLLIGAALQLGVITRLLSVPILTAYLVGAAIIIVASQIPRILGLPTDHAQWWGKTWDVLRSVDQANLWSLGLGIVTIAVVVALRRVAPRSPVFFIALALATLVVIAGDLAADHDVAVVGDIEAGALLPALPDAGLDDARGIIGPAISIALLIFASSAATGSALARRDREEIEPEHEFVGLAAANIGAGLVQGFPASGSDSRSFIVADQRGGSQRMNVFCGLMVIVTLLWLTPLFRNLPLAGLAAVVVVSAVGLIDVAQIRRLWRVRRADFLLAALTLAGVLVFGVLPGIGIGVALSLLEVMRRAVFPHTAVLGPLADTFIYRDVDRHEGSRLIPGLLIYRFDAPLFFANADVFHDDVIELVETADDPVRQVVVNAEGITDMDVTGAQALERLLAELDDRGIRFSLARARTSVRKTLSSLGLEERIGQDNFYYRVADAAAGFAAESEWQAERTVGQAAER